MSKRMLDTNESDRQRAMLTKDERRGLLNEWRGLKPDGDGRKNRSYHQRQIVKRVRHSLLDFSLLYEHLPKNRRMEIFDIDHPPANDEEETKQNEIANELHDGLVDTIAFLFLLLEEDYDSTGIHPQIRRLNFKRVLESGVAKAVGRIEDHPRHMIHVDGFNVEVTEPEWADVDRVIDKIAEGNADELSGGKARWFIQFMSELENDPLSQEKWDIGGWDDLGEQIQQRRVERDDIITREDMKEFADLPDEEVRKQLEDRRSDSDK